MSIGGVLYELDSNLDKPVRHTSLFGVNMGFWAGMASVLLIVILMNVVFWSIKPQNPGQMR